MCECVCVCLCGCMCTYLYYPYDVAYTQSFNLFHWYICVYVCKAVSTYNLMPQPHTKSDGSSPQQQYTNTFARAKEPHKYSYTNFRRRVVWPTYVNSEIFLHSCWIYIIWYFTNWSLNSASIIIDYRYHCLLMQMKFPSERKWSGFFLFFANKNNLQKFYSLVWFTSLLTLFISTWSRSCTCVSVWEVSKSLWWFQLGGLHFILTIRCWSLIQLKWIKKWFQFAAKFSICFEHFNCIRFLFF